MVKCSEVLQCSAVLLVLSCFVYGCMFCILLFNSVSYVFLLTCKLCSVYSLLNWHSPATLTEVFPCFFLSYKSNARVYLAKTGHVPHSSQLVNCVILCIVCVDCVVLCTVCV